MLALNEEAELREPVRNYDSDTNENAFGKSQPSSGTSSNVRRARK